MKKVVGWMGIITIVLAAVYVPYVIKLGLSLTAFLFGTGELVATAAIMGFIGLFIRLIYS